MTNPTDPPSIPEVEALRAQFGDLVRHTPTWQWRGLTIDELELGSLHLKLELFQYTGTFKPRGALANMFQLSGEQLDRGVTSVSAGNHAIATSYAAKVLGSSAKVVMPKTASSARIGACRRYGGKVILVDDVRQAFAKAKEIEEGEGRTFIHPFEGRHTTMGTATVGLEFCQQVESLDLVIIPIGGGGLCAGIASYVKQFNPKCRVIGVEPEGADTMHRSFAAGSPQSIPAVKTIADSLGAPYAAPYTYKVCRDNVDRLVMVDDRALCKAMHLLFADAKLAVEPAGAASTAALLGPLREEAKGANVGLIICGANIDHQTYSEQLAIGT